MSHGPSIVRLMVKLLAKQPASSRLSIETLGHQDLIGSMYQN